MWNKEQADNMLKEFLKNNEGASCQEMQQQTDLQKYFASMDLGFDLCGFYGNFCDFCDKNQEFPCANAYLKMCKETAVQEEVSLADSLKSLSNAKTDANINKKSIAKYLLDTYGDKLVLNQRENYVKDSHLPLADTHFIKGAKKNVCFTYVYENKQGKVLLLVNTNEMIAKAIKENHKSAKNSKFPKSKNSVWVSVPVDESFTEKDVYELLDVLVKA